MPLNFGLQIFFSLCTIYTTTPSNRCLNTTLGHNETLTCIAEHFVLHYDLVAVQGLRVHFIVGVLVGEVEQHLAVGELFIYLVIS